MQFKQGVTYLGIGSAMWLMSHSVMADTVLLDPATLAVGTSVGEFLEVKEGCPDPSKTDCQATEKMKYVSAIAGRLGQIEFAVNLTDNFDVEVNVDWHESFEQHMIALFKADNKSESSLFVRFTYYWANQIEFNYSGRHSPSGNLGWQDGAAINNVELSATGGVASLNINRTPFKDEDGKESDTVALDLSQPYVKLVIGGIRENERLFEVKIKGGTETGTTPSGGGDFESGKQAGIQQCKDNPASCEITVISGDFESGKQAGIQQCKDNPSSCGITVISGDFEAGKQGGIQQCKDNPASCGITVISGDFDSGKQAGIQQCKDNPSSCGLEMFAVCQTGCFGESSIVTSGAHATYTPATGEIHIPLIDAPGPFGGTQTYEIFLMQKPLTFTFDLDTNRVVFVR